MTMRQFNTDTLLAEDVFLRLKCRGCISDTEALMPELVTYIHITMRQFNSDISRGCISETEALMPELVTYIDITMRQFNTDISRGCISETEAFMPELMTYIQMIM
eukprot:TRINITY_DN43762_c0_g1_i14.p1 TRINITY_DN43762_c0_g1~~TRINITY_DN43762_c0_g1_i14.p1  ORF type:complete len:105 (-),score=6.64 TRINITY_DN43762_c0_g1_i14:22-336(-)